MNDLNHNHLENGAEFASKKAWEKPEILELKASLTDGSKGTSGGENPFTSLS